MAHGKETPRQKMIGMMYLVLTALLALNVSTSVLDAFKIIDEALEKTGVTMENKNKDIYTEFDQATSKPGKTPLARQGNSGQEKLKTVRLHSDLKVDA
jgi:hypothetical protein